MNVYVQTKLEGERLISAACPNHLIFRTSWVYAARGGNFAKTMLRLARAREWLSVIGEQFGTPTCAGLLAEVSAHAIRQGFSASGGAGLYHLTAAGETSWHGYAKYVLAQAAQAQSTKTIVLKTVFAVLSSAFPTRVRRLHNSSLDTSKLQKTFGLNMPQWQSGMARMFSETLST